jgi:S1-C subfamily serine protease
MLQGVSGLGVGMQDGDVITSVAGAGVSTRSEIVTAVMHARARRAKEISAVFWRAEVPWSLVVEMPYPTRRRRPSGDTGQKPR